MTEQPVDSTQPGSQEAPSLSNGTGLAYQGDASGFWNIYTALLASSQ
jgi:hypothetical protein